MVKMWNSEPTDKLLVFKAHAYPIISLVALPNNTLAMCSTDGIKIWDLNNLKELISLDEEGCDDGKMRSLIALPDGRLAYKVDGYIRIWDTRIFTRPTLDLVKQYKKANKTFFTEITEAWNLIKSEAAKIQQSLSSNTNAELRIN
jgi:WD40 repeat protein